MTGEFRGRPRAALLAVAPMALVMGLMASVSNAEQQGPATPTMALANQVYVAASDSSVRVLQWLHRARQTGNRQTSQCLDQHLSEIHAVLRDVTTHIQRLERALVENKRGPAAHQRLVIRYLERRLGRLDRAASQCAAQVKTEGTTKVQMTAVGTAPAGEPAPI